ncbi:MAG: Asp-tRNA(Asn)/Glu-tRNA(Gln) amidotransferase subunit GatB [Candidatus Krumholzibacteria bacterium]|nr:Asp-tRNA(Asn)/Glu-tRNA(Gln) amidotransferase subunit GatB [Candidatus Krumholzibacteria bacterium]
MRDGKYEAVIGLEIHVQLLTATKLFCACPAEFGGEPNTRVCPVCLGLPGALPVVNREAVRMAVLLGTALGCDVRRRSVFARKNYFYPDCPRNYQISMFDKPLCENGVVELDTDDIHSRIRIERIHLEDDSGKLIHQRGGGSLVDFNRCGVPLAEIVTKPDLRTPAEARLLVKQLRQLVRYLGICDGNLEEGSMRCDVNVSLRKPGESELGTKTEIKNLNSFKAIELGLEAEIARQSAMLDAGKVIEQVTSLWDSQHRESVVMRSKEEAHDYRYFREPDLEDLVLDDELLENVRSLMPELPGERKKRFIDQYGLSDYETVVLTAEMELADFYEEVAGLTGDPKASSNWVMREVMGELNSTGRDLGNLGISPQGLAELINQIAAGRISGTAGKDVFGEMVRSGANPGDAIALLGLEQLSGDDEIADMVEKVLEASDGEVKRYREGEKKLFGYFVGQVMKMSGGRANPSKVNEILKKLLL